MKLLFKAIRNGEMDEVIRILDRHPELLDCPSTPPPKKDAGQSPLQVAIKIGKIDIANYLIQRGADVNYMEPANDINKWNTPVLHDAIISTISACCYENYERSAQSLKILNTLLERGAEPNKPDSFGQIAWDTTENQIIKILDMYPDELQSFACKQARKIFTLLCKYGSQKVEPSYFDNSFWKQEWSATLNCMVAHRHRHRKL